MRSPKNNSLLFSRFLSFKYSKGFICTFMYLFYLQVHKGAFVGFTKVLRSFIIVLFKSSISAPNKNVSPFGHIMAQVCQTTFPSTYFLPYVIYKWSRFISLMFGCPRNKVGLLTSNSWKLSFQVRSSIL